MPISNDAQTELDWHDVVADTFVEQVHHRETVDSTNNVALKYCSRDDLQTPLLVIAEQQTSGRGRGANRWWSARGSLTFSLVIRPDDLGLVERKWPQISLTAGLSVCLAIKELVPDMGVSLKWPNDVYLKHRKISGMLIEVGPRLSQTLVIGIGVNVNNSLRMASHDVQAIATSLVDATGKEFKLSRILTGILLQLETQLGRLSGDDSGLAADWQRHCALLGQRLEIETGEKRFVGLCQGIDEEGALLLLTKDGSTRFFSGVVKRIE